MKTKLIMLAFVLTGILGLSKNSFSQPLITTIGNYSACPGQKLYMPIEVTNWTDIASMSLTIKYDPAVLTYLGDTLRNPALLATFQINSPTAGKVILAWFSVSPVSFAGTDTVNVLKFSYVSGSSNLTWDTLTNGACQYSDLFGNTVLATFISGTVTGAGVPPVVTMNPFDATVNTNGNASFHAAAQGTNTFQWQVSTNSGGTWGDVSNGTNYAGSTGPTLYVNNAPLTFNNYWYRCNITSGGSCSVTAPTHKANLTVLGPPTQIITTVGSIDTCPGVNIVVPIWVQNMAGVNSISLKLMYDTVKLTYVTYQNFNPSLSTSVLQVNGDVANQDVALAWFDAGNAANFGNGKLIEFVFHYNMGVVPLNWNTLAGNCEYTDLNGFPLAAQFINGVVTLPGPAVTTNPVDANAIAADNVTFSVSGNNIDTYQWQKLTGNTWVDLTNTVPYSNVTTATLNISAVTVGMDGFQYRCAVTGMCSPQVSDPATLHVISPLPVVTSIVNATTCQGQITVPVSVSSFLNVGSFKLTLTIPANLTFTGISNVNAAITSTVHASVSAGQLIITDTNATSLNFGTGNLLNIIFNAGPGASTNLNWVQTAGSSWYKTLGGTTLTTTFANGVYTINPVPGLPGAITGSSSLCQNANATPYITSGSANATSYLWAILPTGAGTISGTSTTGTVTWNSTYTGPATVTVAGGNSCGQSSTVTFSITIHPVPVVTLTTQPSYCLNSGPHPLSGGDPVGGSYSGTGISSNTFNPIVAGVGGPYTVTYTYSNGFCSNSASGSITVNAVPTVTFGTIPPVCVYWPAFFLTTGTPVGGTYYGNGVTLSSGNYVFTPGSVTTGNQVCNYTYANPTTGCTDTASIGIFVDPCVGIAGINDNLSISIQPNPSNGVFTLSINNIVEKMDLFIYNDLGQIVYQENLNLGTKNYSKDIDLSVQPKGLYFLRLAGKESTKIEKIVLK